MLEKIRNRDLQKSRKLSGVVTDTLKKAVRLERGHRTPQPIYPPDVLDQQPIEQRKSSFNRITFILFVVFPTILGAFYYSFIVSDQFTTESRMVVRAIGVSERFDEPSEDGDAGSLIDGSAVIQDAHIVASFLKSTELVDILQNQIDLVSMFSNSDIDYFSKLNADANLQEITDFWEDQIYVYVDGPSGIIIFGVRAFRPADALTISQSAIQAASTMIDNLSERAKLDVVKRAEHEVVKSSNAYTQALEDLRNYQNEVRILDPLADARVTNEVITQLISRRLEAEALLAVHEANGTSQSPTANQTRKLLGAIEQQIEQQQSNLTGIEGDRPALSGNLVRFSELETQRLVTESIYEAAQRNLDVAKSTAIRRTTFVSVFSNPRAAEEADYPKRFSSFLIIALGGLVFWSVLSLLRASIKDHR